MASNREERFRMRQRGAGTRDLRDSGFNLAIPEDAGTPSQTQPTGVASTAPASQKKASSAGGRVTAATPALDDVQESPLESVAAGTSGAQVPHRSHIQTTQTPTISRKRKSTETAGAARKRSRVSIAKSGSAQRLQQSETETDDVLESPVTFVHPSTSTKAHPRSSLGNSSHAASDSAAEEQELLSPESVPSSELRQERTPVKMSAKKAGKQKVPLEPQQDKSSTSAKKAGKQKATLKTRREKSPAISAKKRGKQKVPLHQSSGNAVRARDRQTAGRSRVSQSPNEQSDEEEAASGDAREPQSSSRSQPSTSRRKSPKKKLTKRPSTGANTRPHTGKPRARRRSSGAGSRTYQKPTSSTRQAPTDAIPITVHRLTNASALNFFQPSAEGDELAAPPPSRKHAGVNSIDVLSQITRELVDKAAAAFRSGNQGANRSEGRRKAAVIEGFGEELEERMLWMTAALDHNIGLQQHLRTQKKTRTALLAELQDLQTRRRNLSLKHDAVRAEHEVAARQARKENELDQMLRDIELAAQRGRDAQQRLEENGEGEGEVGLELRIRDVVERVSSAGGRTGLLQRLQRFNNYLEAVVGLPDTTGS